MLDIESLRKKLGWGAAYAAFLPFLWKTVLVIQVLSVNDLKYRPGVDVNVSVVISSGLFAFVVISVCLATSKFLLGKWIKPLLYIFGAFLFIEIVQDVTLIVTAQNIQDCGYPVCGFADEPRKVE